MEGKMLVVALLMGSGFSLMLPVDAAPGSGTLEAAAAPGTGPLCCQSDSCPGCPCRIAKMEESEGTNEARFTIKETVCRKPDAGQRMGCAYRAGGLEKNCSAEMKENRFTVVCSSLETSKGGEGSNPSGGGRDTYSRERTVIITQNYPSASPVSDHTERKISHREFDQHHDNDHEDNRKDDQHDEGDHTDDHEDDHEDDQHDEGDHMDDHEDDYENDQHDEDALADIVIQFSNDPPRAGGPVRPQGEKRKPLSGVYLGRILCLECIFNEFPRK